MVLTNGTLAPTERILENTSEKPTRRGASQSTGVLPGTCSSTQQGDFFEQHVDLEKYINYLVASTLVQHWDSYNKNHYLAFDGKGSCKWYVIPWDLDRTLGDFFGGRSGSPALAGRCRRLTQWDHSTQTVHQGTARLPEE
ncbi:MAG: hypothetical protein EXS36_17350 [Pedosphaera sp.]|nr:hypothetical protein [Pedosphaera sp.]